MNNINDINNYIKSLYKKIYLAKKEKNNEYISNKKKCDIFLFEIYPNVVIIIDNINNNIGDKDKNINTILNIAKKYSYNINYSAVI